MPSTYPSGLLGQREVSKMVKPHSSTPLRKKRAREEVEEGQEEEDAEVQVDLSGQAQAENVRSEEEEADGEDETAEDEEEEYEEDQLQQQPQQQQRIEKPAVRNKDKGGVPPFESSDARPSPSLPVAAEEKKAKEEEKEVTFASLGVVAPLCEACASLNWRVPTQIQRESLPFSLAGRDIIGLAETGSGKTAAFALPMLQSLLDTPQSHFGLVLAPTRELAFQIAEQIEALGAGIGVKVVTLVGGVDLVAQAIALSKKPHIICATPGRIVDHLENTKGFHLRQLKFLVLDEADRLLNMDFEKEIDQILSVIPRNRHTFLFSATMTSQVAKLQRASLVNPVKVEVSKKYQTTAGLRQEYIFLPAFHKDIYLTFIVNQLNGHSIIIFTATCEHTTLVTLLLRHLGFTAIPLHGKMTQTRRLGALTAFKSGSMSILVATDVASRGLDIPTVDVVINYDIPTHSKDYIHRVGRTARAGRTGLALTLVTQYDVELFQRIEHLLGYQLKEYPATKEEGRVLLLMERVNEALKIARLEMKEKEDEKKRWGKGGGKGVRGGEKREEESGDAETETERQLDRLGLNKVRAMGGDSGSRGGGRRGGRGPRRRGKGAGIGGF